MNKTEWLSRELLSENSKKNMLRIQARVEEDEEMLDALFTLFQQGSKKEVQRSAWVIGTLPLEYLSAKWAILLERAAEDKSGDAIKRNVMRQLQFADLPEKEESAAWDLAFRLASARSEAIAIRAFAFGCLEKMARKYPELIPETLALAEQELPYTNKGLENRIRHVIRRLS